MVSEREFESVERDYGRAAQVLIEIGLRILDEEGPNEPDSGLRPSVN